MQLESFSSWTYYRRWHERFFQDENALGVRTVIAEDALDRVRSAVAAVGYISIGELAGWCLTVRGGLLSKITLHEYVDFYYSDRVYADELLRIGMRHALVVNSRVDHLAHVTLDKEPGIRGLINEGQEPKYRAAISEEVEDRWQRYLERRARGPELLY